MSVIPVQNFHRDLCHLGEISARSRLSRLDLGEISFILPRSRRDLCDNTNLANLAEISVKFLHGSDTQQF